MAKKPEKITPSVEPTIESTKEPTTEPATEPTMNISVSDFNALTNRINILEQTKRPSEDDLPIIGGIDEERELTTRVKTFKDRPVIRIEKVESKGKDSQGQPIMECTIITVGKDGKETEHPKADYLELTKATAEVCRIIDSKRISRTEPGPVVTIKVWDDKAQSEVKTGKRVRAAINFVEEEFKVEWHGEVYKTKELNVPN